MPIILLFIILLPSLSNAASFSYDDIFPARRTIKVVVKNDEYEKRQERIREYEERQIELEIQKLEREEKQQTAQATHNLAKEIASLEPFRSIINKDGVVENKVNRLFIRRILYHDTWNKG